MESTSLVDCVGRRRSPATLPGYHRGRPPRNKGLRYPPDPPTVDETVAVMRAAGDSQDGVRLRGVIVVLWRAGLRISEAGPLTKRHRPGSRTDPRLRPCVRSGCRHDRPSPPGGAIPWSTKAIARHTHSEP